MEGRVFENFQKNQRNCKIPKMPKNVPKSIQTCFEIVLGQTFRKIFCPVFHGRSSLRKFSKKSKKLQNTKSAQNRSQKYPNVFSTCFGSNFSKNFFAQCSVEGRVFENFQTKYFQNPKCPKVFPKVSKRVLNMFWGNCSKNFMPSVPWRVSLRKFS